jgi:protein phosphatase
MKALALQVGSRTDPGRVRQVNEDAIGVDRSARVVVLADGLAQRQGAEVASRLAVSSLLDHLVGVASGGIRTESMRAAFAGAEHAIAERIASEPRLAGMGAAAIAVRFGERRLQVGHIGDARLYRWRRDRLERLTVDHSFVQTQLATGRVTEDEARASRSRHLVTRALGCGDQARPDVAEHAMESGDVYLLCTDGLHELIDERDVGDALAALGANAQLSADTLVTMANDRGGTDNVSVVVVCIGAEAATSAARPGLLTRLGSVLGAWRARPLHHTDGQSHGEAGRQS